MTPTTRRTCFERSGGVTSLVSTGPLDVNSAFGASFRGASEDGARVFFETNKQLVAADTDGTRVDVYERSGGVANLVSAMDPGGAFDVFAVEVSEDGRRVFFQTDGQLLADDTDGSVDLYSAARGDPFGPGPGTPSSGADTPLSRLALAGPRVQRILRQGGLVVTASCDRRCAVNARASVSVPGASRVHRLRGASRSVPANSRARLMLRLTSRARRAIAKALRSGRRLRARVTVTARDTAGNTRTARRTVRLRR